MSVSQAFFTSISESDTALEEWLERLPISFSCSQWTDEEFGGFISALEYPKFLKSETLSQLLNTHLTRIKDGEIYVDVFEVWRDGLRPEQFEDGDRYEFQALLMHIVYSWRSFMAKFSPYSLSSFCKRSVDSLIELAFQLRDGADQVWRPDAELVLPDELDPVQADSITSMNVPNFWKTLLSSSPHAHNFSWSYTNEPWSIITFVFTVSTDVDDSKQAQSRMQLCLYSAQQHRRAWCCTDGPVFGAILHKDILQFYISFWQSDTLAIMPIIGHFPLQDFAGFVRSYFILCRISEYQSRWLQKELKRWKDATLSHLGKLKHAAEHPWRRKARDETRSGFRDENEDDGDDTAEGAETCDSRPKCARDRLVERILERIRRAPYSPETGHPLTRIHKKAFDFVTGAEKSEETHALCAPAAWAEDAYKHSHEYEDPAPYVPDEVQNKDALMDVDQPIGSENATVSLDGKTLLVEVPPSGTTKNAFVRNGQLNGDAPQLGAVHARHALDLDEDAKLVTNLPRGVTTLKPKSPRNRRPMRVMAGRRHQQKECIGVVACR